MKLSLKQFFILLSSLALIVFLSLYSSASWADGDLEEQEKQLESSLEIIGRGPVIPMSNNQSLPITSTNIEYIDVDILKIHNPAQFLNNHYYHQSLDSWDMGELNQSYTSVFADRYSVPNFKTNEIISSRIKLPQSLESGWYVVMLKPAGNYNYYDTRFQHVLLTDIGIQAKLYQDQIHIRAAKLSDGKVLTHGEATLYRKGKKVETQPLNEHGEATFVQKSTKTDLIIVESGDQQGVLSLREIALDLSEFAIDGLEHQTLNAFVYSNRDLVRPGDSLPIHILLRDEDGKNLPAQPLTLTLLNAKNSKVFEKRINPSMAGYYTDLIQTQYSWPMGRYRLEVRTTPDAKPIETFRFQVEEFTPERMDLTITPPPKLPFADGTIDYQLYGKYLFGTPASKNTLITNVTYTPVHYFKGEFSQFYVGQENTLSRNNLELDDIQLSEQGLAEIHIPTSTDEAMEWLSPIRIDSNFSLLESNGAAVQRNASEIIWRRQNIPGVSPHSKEFNYNSTAIFDIALLSPRGDKAIAGKVEMTVLRDQGKYYWTYEEGSGWTRHEQDRWNVEKQQVLSLTGVEQVQVPVMWGEYRLIIKDLATGISTNYEFYAGWSQLGAEQKAVKPDQIDIQLNKESYQNGDTAQVTIDAPVAGDLTLAVDATHSLWRKTLSVSKGKQTIEIPIADDWNRHDMYITALLTANINDEPKRYFGIRALKIDREARKLDVSIDLPDMVRPMKKATFSVKVDNILDDKMTDNNSANGQKTWVTLSLVDRGIINLSRFEPQHPFNFFYGQRRYSVDVIDLYSRLYDLRPDPFATSRFGSDKVNMNNNQNDDLAEIKTITWMSNAVEVVNGVATFELDIPDYNGQVQVIATAFNDEQYGQFVADQIIVDSTIVELGSPAFFVPKDNSTLAVEVVNKTDKKQQYTLEISSDNDAISFNSETSKTFSLDVDKRTSFRFPITINEEFSHTRNQIIVSVKNDIANNTLKNKHDPQDEKVDIERSWSIPLRPSLPQVTKRVETILPANESYQVDANLWQGLFIGTQNAGLITASYSPIIDITTATEQLFHYPYGCTEQVTSGAFPFLLESPQFDTAKEKALRKYGEFNKNSEDSALAYAVQKIAQRQLEKGGFSLWDNGQYEDYWATVYATDFLIQVRKRDPNLASQELVDKALERVTNYIKRDIAMPNETLAYATYLAASQGKLTWSDLPNKNEIIDSQDVTKLAKIQYAASKAYVGDIRQAEEILEDVKNTDNKGYYKYGSSLRDNALIAVIAEQLKSQSGLSSQALLIKNQALNDLRQEMKNRRWFSTQENYALVRAGLIANQENQKEIKLTFNGNNFATKGMVNLEISPDDQLTNNGQESLYLNIATQGYPKDKSLVPSTMTNEVEHSGKTLFYLNHKKYDGKPLKVGDRLLVIANVTLKKYMYDALYVDMLPMGFALENPNLNQGPDIESLLADSIEMPELEHSEYRQDRYVAAANIDYNSQHFAYIIRAEVPGIYQVPSGHLESMYDPERRLWIDTEISSITIEDKAKEDDSFLGRIKAIF